MLKWYAYIHNKGRKLKVNDMCVCYTFVRQLKTKHFMVNLKIFNKRHFLYNMPTPERAHL